ncbi:MAG: HipA family kinase [Steroidobacteraceae bacterium]
MRIVTAVRYVTPLREGGSLPAIVEGDDEGLYVLKFRGAGQGAKSLVAELLAGEIARLLELAVPEIVFMELPVELARTEPDPEIQSLIRASGGLNLALDYLPGSITFDPLVYQPDTDLASAIVWFDAYVCNVDRTARNVNMLLWHRHLWLIDHGAALYFHHDWNRPDVQALTPFPLIRDHVLLSFAGSLPAADARLKPLLSREKLSSLVELIPGPWLAQDGASSSAAEQRAAYLEFFCDRLQNSAVFLNEAIRARGAPR